MKIRKLVNAVLSKTTLNRKKMVSSTLLGKQLTTIAGTVRATVDQDDAWFYYLSKHSTNIFDLGANVGYFGLLANINHKIQRMVLVDANAEALADAAKNLFFNGLGQNCNFYPAFVGKDLHQKVKFYTVGAGAAGSMYKTHSETAAIFNTSTEVETTTVDYLTEFYGFEPDFVKVDVEGAEGLVLEGATKLALKQITRFLVEMHAPPELPMLENARMVIEWCGKNNYVPWYLKEEIVLRDPNTISHRGKCHLLLQPKGMEFPQFLEGIKQSAPLPNN